MREQGRQDEQSRQGRRLVSGAPAIGSMGEVWQPVRAPDGSTGWVKRRYLLDAQGNASP